MIKPLKANADEFINKSFEVVYLFDKQGRVMFNDDGETLFEDEKNAIAKLVEKVEEGKQTGVYYVRRGRGDLYDPYGPYDINRNTAHLYPFVKTEKDVFDTYIKYLRERKSTYLTNARREFMIRGYK